MNPVMGGATQHRAQSMPESALFLLFQRIKRMLHGSLAAPSARAIADLDHDSPSAKAPTLPHAHLPEDGPAPRSGHRPEPRGGRLDSSHAEDIADVRGRHPRGLGTLDPKLRCEEAGYAIRLAAPEIKTYQEHGYPAKSDLSLKDAHSEDFFGLLISGGSCRTSCGVTKVLAYAGVLRAKQAHRLHL